MKYVCKAHPNIALIKYWGKLNEAEITPINGSLSVTLDFGETETFAEFSDIDSFMLNGKPAEITNRLKYALDFFRKYTEGEKYFRVSSKNNFPTAAGFASSASGSAAFVGALASLVGQTSNPIEFWEKKGINLSVIARHVSGSGCRSIYGGFVEWIPGDNHNSISKELFNCEHWKEFCAFSVVLRKESKKVSSTKGMQQTCKTVPWMKWRAENVVPNRIKDAIKFIKDKDFEKLAPIIMQESNELHANCAATFPPIHYLNDDSYEIINEIHQLNDSQGKYVAAYSFDAGPNPFIFTTTPYVELVRKSLANLSCVNPDKITLSYQSTGIKSQNVE